LLITNYEKNYINCGSGLVKYQMPKYLNQIKALKKINKSIVTNNKFLINKEGNIKIYYAPFDYVNSKAKIMIVGITPGLQQCCRVSSIMMAITKEVKIYLALK